MSTRKTIIICAGLLAAVILLPRIFPSLSGKDFIWLVFLLCPLMHIFMMKGGHGHDHGGAKHNDHADENGGHSCCGGHKNHPETLETKETDKK